MAGHSRLKDGVASARLCPAIHVFRAAVLLLKTWMPGTSPGMTIRPNCRSRGALRYPWISNPHMHAGNAMTEFDPATHRMVPEQRWFEDFAVGERFVLPGRTQSTAIFAAFQTA